MIKTWLQNLASRVGSLRFDPLRYFGVTLEKMTHPSGLEVAFNHGDGGLILPEGHTLEQQDGLWHVVSPEGEAIPLTEFEGLRTKQILNVKTRPEGEPLIGSRQGKSVPLGGGVNMQSQHQLAERRATQQGEADMTQPAEGATPEEPAVEAEAGAEVQAGEATPETPAAEPTAEPTAKPTAEPIRSPEAPTVKVETPPQSGELVPAKAGSELVPLEQEVKAGSKWGERLCKVVMNDAGQVHWGKVSAIGAGAVLAGSAAAALLDRGSQDVGAAR
ncbi:MAG: hypothetical protein CMM94_03410 [Rickettsiales bacterium]|nr:hypothetical protein [Rickettsiales bacterium]